jgi:hypothetical protein
MMIKIPETANEKIVPPDNAIKRMQRLRLRRFKMALATYAVVLLAILLVTRLGLGVMSGAQWAICIGLALLGNCVFFILFHTNTNLRFPDPSLTREQILYSAIWGIVLLYALPEARPIVLQFYLPAFSFGMLHLTRRQYLAMVPCVMGLYAALLVSEYYHERQGLKIQYELFLFAVYGILLTWFAFFGGFVSNIRRRLRAQKEEIQKFNENIKIEIKNRNRAEIEKDKLIFELKEALNEVKTLSGLLPICASCKKIRDDKGYWNQIESYIASHLNVKFSHGLCPDCAKKLYPDIIDNKKP